MAFVPTTIPVTTGATLSAVGNRCVAPVKWGTHRLPLRSARLLPGMRRQGGLVVRMEVGVGSAIPTFDLPTNGGGSLSDADVAKGPTIVYFYPRDATPGCTTEAKDFRDLLPQLADVGASVVGVSKDSVESHDRFVAALDLPFPLVSDDGTLVEGFGVWKLKKRGDKETMGVERSTFVVKDGKIALEWRGVKSGGHAAKVVEAVKQM